MLCLAWQLNRPVLLHSNKIFFKSIPTVSVYSEVRIVVEMHEMKLKIKFVITLINLLH